MDFTIDCNIGIHPGSTEAECRGFLGIGPDERTSGEVNLGGSSRLISFFVSGGLVFSIEILSLIEGDTFCGVDLAYLPVKFTNSLTRSGIDASCDPPTISISNSPVSMYIENNEVSSICWELTRPQGERLLDGNYH